MKKRTFFTIILLKESLQEESKLFTQHNSIQRKSICNNNDYFSGDEQKQQYIQTCKHNISEISSEIRKITSKKEGREMLHKNVTASKSSMNLCS